MESSELTHSEDWRDMRSTRWEDFLIPWMVFTALYWIAAVNKPFHVDEFFSWVYAQRSSIREIITLKDFGIGHPPLFHVLQKMVISIFPVHHPWHVRLVNYLIGSVFVLVLIGMLSRIKRNVWFFVGLAGSACLLNIFVFSRMWGLVCLASLLLLWSGESYVSHKTLRNALLFQGAGILGLMSDYVFILMLPYMAAVMLSGRINRNRLKLISLGWVVFACMASAFIYLRLGKDLASWIYYLFGSVSKLLFEAGNLILNFWFVESYVFSLIALACIYFLRQHQLNAARGGSRFDRQEVVLIGVIVFIIIEVFIRQEMLRVRYAIPIVLLLGIFAFFRRSSTQKNYFVGEDYRLLIGMVGAGTMLLLLNPFSWREIRETRFLGVMLPLLLVFVYRALDRVVINALSVVLLISGIVYITSSGVSDYFPPKQSSTDSSTLYQNVYAYSDTYLRFDGSESAMPYFLDMNPFLEHCRVCIMGEDKIPFSDLPLVKIIAWASTDSRTICPPKFSFVGRSEIGLTRTDRFQFTHFTPIYPRHFAISEFAREGH